LITRATVAVLIVACPFLESADDCAVNLIQQQRRKGGELGKNGGLADLFGVGGEALSETTKAQKESSRGVTKLFRYEAGQVCDNLILY
jgi:hypothetical protein